MNLLLDLGNTRLKWARAEDGALTPGAPLAWADETMLHGLARRWAALPNPARVLVASVAGAERDAALAEAVRVRFHVEAEFVRSPAAACGVRNAYAEPERLGVDRFLAMVAARAQRLAPCVIAGGGTALTLDALAGDGRHLGGLIAPGPALMQSALRDAAARVVVERPGRIVDAADNTPDALASGCWQAAAALIERFHAHMAAALGGAPRVLLAGGDADALGALLAVPHQPLRDAVLRGLVVWAAAHPA
ncbi:MAG: type III pantothenate kinase [Xanthomonadaceae bacterium]|nr:type III pantothenate kinase [Xanthomonadaceae bacterium]